MCFGCQCPEPIPPPNQILSKCRKMLQILAIGLVVIGIIGLTISQIFQFFYNLILVYFLWMGWTTFNWCMTLMFFLFCTIQSIEALIIFIGMIQYDQLFAKNFVVTSIYFLLQLVYYPVAVYFSHYCYKNFKHHFEGNAQMFPALNRANNAPQQPQGGNYQRIDEGRQQRQQNNNNDGGYFRGQGVRIG